MDQQEWLERFFGREREAPEFLGLTEQEARAKAQSSDLLIRLLRPGGPHAMHLDHRGDRVNVVVDDDQRVIMAGYF